MQDDAPKTRPDPSPESQVARMLVRAVWQLEWSAANPEGNAKERQAAWKLVRAEQTTTRGKVYRKALSALKRAGVTFVLPEDVVEDDEA